ncbi:TPA: fumarate hydratase [bacterium]|nr:fumarate hydratase [bacterium]
MRKIDVAQIEAAVYELSLEANFVLPEDVVEALKEAEKKESSERAREVLATLLDNAQLAKVENLPICQDTGIVVVLLEIGQAVEIVGGDLSKAINQGVRRGYKEGYLRFSMVNDPLIRENTNDNTPAIIHTEIVSGETLRIVVIAKGSGSENMSSLKMLKPSDGIKGIKDYIISHIRDIAPFSCPPLVIGIGLGGTFESCAYLAKKALIRRVGSSHPREDIAQIEKDLLNEINRLGIGPCGLGGEATALAVQVETFPTHIASLPVAINVNCHAHRHKERVI